jgi:hypothetical protein
VVGAIVEVGGWFCVAVLKWGKKKSVPGLYATHCSFWIDQVTNSIEPNLINLTLQEHTPTFDDLQPLP